ncbi:MAG: hypothetical protein HS101_14495 [Planctomycetia bacterium]|jgi:hypothetical protein|nr:hypothetical protein [Planctomycetia bacterium]MCC7314935.1 hypothetical protein [Planctomycetota bacterium]OQY95972.1 MAG: hypothetical protein B6D36_19890 [Planctomycetes bacterium UTPLA1]
MSVLVPNRFLFKFEFPIHRAKKGLPINGDVAAWGDEFALPPLCTIDGEEPFGQVYAAWNEGGIYIGCKVSEKSRPLRCDPDNFRNSDCLRLLTDMRDTRDIRRASRFCQHFFFMPSGGGSKGREACAGSAKISRATQDAPLVSPGDILTASKVSKTGYSLTAHLPARVMAGFDPVENPRIGFYYMLEDTELGQQALTIGDDLNWWIDPSTWATAVMRR